MCGKFARRIRELECVLLELRTKLWNQEDPISARSQQSTQNRRRSKGSVGTIGNNTSYDMDSLNHPVRLFHLAVAAVILGCHGTHRSTLPVIAINPSGHSSAEKPQA